MVCSGGASQGKVRLGMAGEVRLGESVWGMVWKAWQARRCWVSSCKVRYGKVRQAGFGKLCRGELGSGRVRLGN